MDKDGIQGGTRAPRWPWPLISGWQGLRGWRASQSSPGTNGSSGRLQHGLVPQAGVSDRLADTSILGVVAMSILRESSFQMCSWAPVTSVRSAIAVFLAGGAVL